MKKCLYGLKQSSRVRGKHFSDFLLSNRFHPSDDDSFPFTRKENGELTMVIIWIDDVIIPSNRQMAIDELVVALNNKFKNCSHPIDSFVGIKMGRNWTVERIHKRLSSELIAEPYVSSELIAEPYI